MTRPRNRSQQDNKMAQDAIIAEDLTYRYGELRAVDRISFRVAEGEILGFLGPNGAGKTTTVKMLTGQLQPQEGRATILGMDVTKRPEKVQAQIGVCFELTNLYEQMTAEENLKLFADLFGVKFFDAGALLSRVGLAGRDRLDGERGIPIRCCAESGRGDREGRYGRCPAGRL